jgi:hypothetical protein
MYPSTHVHAMTMSRIIKEIVGCPINAIKISNTHKKNSGGASCPLIKQEREQNPAVYLACDI